MFSFRDQSVDALEVTGTAITFGGLSIPSPPGETLTYARAGTDGQIAGPSSAGNAWLYRSGLWYRLNANPVGGWGVVVDDTFVAWQEENAGGVYRMPLDFSAGATLLPVPWQATGLLDMVNGVVRADDRSQPFSVTWGGVTYLCQLWMTRAGRTVMQANNMPGGSGVVVWDANTSQLWRVYSGDMQIPPRLSEDGTVVALTGGVPDGFIHDGMWTLEPMEQPIPPIVPLTKPTLFGAFLHPQLNGYAPSWANASLDEGIGGHVLAGPDGQRWTVCDLEQTPGAVIPSPACYIGSQPQAFEHLLMRDNRYDLFALELYRDPGISDADFEEESAAWLSLMPNPTVIITNSTTRLGPNGPTLTPRDVQAAQSILSRFGLPVLVFEAGRPGEVPETAAQFTQWRNGQPCPPQVLPPGPPTPHGLAQRKMLL